MKAPLPSKDMVLQACMGTMAIQHPVLQAVYELASLHEARLDAAADVGAIDCERARLMYRIDDWVAAQRPQAYDAAYLHTETVGMVIDRLAQFSVDARVGSEQPTLPLRLRYARHRLTELAVAYGDLSFEITAGTRRLPGFSFPVAEGDSAGRPGHRA